MKMIAKWLAAISIIVLAVNIIVLVAGDHVTSALINGDYNISAGTFISVISFVVRAIHIGAAVACGILAVAAWKCSKQKAPSASQAKGE